MHRLLHPPLRSLRRGGVLYAALLIFCTSCASVVTPNGELVPGQPSNEFTQIPIPVVDVDNPPPLPFDGPNILGRTPPPAPPPPPTPPPPIPELTRQSALTCIATGREVYGIALANTNVRTEPAVNSCRIGRAPRGTLVRIDGLYEQGDLTKLNSLRRAVATVADDSGGSADISTVTNGTASTNSQTNGESESSSTESLVLAFQAVTASNKLENGSPQESSSVNYEIGYEEDVLPIFQRACAACHNNIAQTKGLVVTDYDSLLKGSESGTMLVPGSLDGSMLWWQIFTNKMPIVGQLSDDDKAVIKEWITVGAPERRGLAVHSEDSATAKLFEEIAKARAEAEQAGSVQVDLAEDQTASERRSATSDLGEDASGERVEIENIWLELNADDFDDVPNSCEYDQELPHTLVSGGLIQLLSCGVEPDDNMLARIRTDLEQIAPPVAAASTSGSTTSPARFAGGSSGGISAAPLNVGPPLDSDEFMVPKGNFCLEPRYMKLQDQKSITAMTFAPDGRLFMAIDDMPTGQNVDPLILLDANHPSRYIAVIDSTNGGGYVEILREKGRITGLDYHNGALYVSLAGEVGVIPDGQEYKKLAGGFAVASQYFHANNGIVVSDGWVYVSTGGVRDGWSDGPIVGMDEAGAMHAVTGGNPWASRIVRARLDVLLNERSINNFETASRGWRNPYGLARGPDGRLWVTDNGATNVPEGTSAGDEVNVFDPRTIAPGTPDGETPFFGFPLALTNGNPGWYTEPVIAMPNAGAPTGISWAYGTVYYGQYGVQPGLYRLARGGGGTITERVMMGWPIVSLATAPDGSLWLGMGTGGVYRYHPC